MVKPESMRIACHECNRGGRGNDPNKCSCGWRIVRPSTSGCYLGTPIIGDPVEPPPEPKLTRSQRRYREFKAAQEWYTLSFADWIGVDREAKNRRERLRKLGIA